MPFIAVSTKKSEKFADRRPTALQRIVECAAAEKPGSNSSLENLSDSGHE
jgi:hypothetical protein